MKKIILIFLITMSANAWEVTTHRAIDIQALEIVKEENLKAFLDNTQIGNKDYPNEKFEGYKDKETGQAITYFNYFKSEKSDDAMAEQNMTFSDVKVKDLIEAGTMLEDAVYPDAGLLLLGGDGRFNNHYYDPQNGGKALTWGYGPRSDAISWTIGYKKQLNPFDTRHYNAYSYTMAKEYFKYAFTEAEKSERRRLQAKMFVSIGHVMHMINDMNVPSHVRDDSHPLWDSLSYSNIITSFFEVLLSCFT